MAVSEHEHEIGDELITWEDARHRRELLKPNGEPRAIRTLQDWAQRGWLPVAEQTPHNRLVNWSAYLRRLHRTS